MIFPIAGVHVSTLYLIAVGFIVGILGGFFGVGASFLAGPALFAVGVPMNFVVGTDLAHIVGKSIVAARKHRTLGNIDLRLGGIMVIGTIAGVETGAQLIQMLKRTAHIDAAVGGSFIVILLGISTFMGWESWHTWQMLRRQRKNGTIPKQRSPKDDVSAFSHLAKTIQNYGLPPHISLPAS